jgi:hypothetical protein
MIRSRRTSLGVIAGFAVVFVSSFALAQAGGAAPPAAGTAPPAAGTAPAAGGVKTTGTPANAPATGKTEGYGYEFTDDPLNAGGFGPNDATIRVRPGPVRTTLIRPRTSFVPEMLKSVENL